MSSCVFDERVCQLGEGPLWHPGRGQLFWFDILGKKLLSRKGDTAQEWQFDEHVSAAGWVNKDTLLIATETGLWNFDLRNADKELVVELEADQPLTRSNDGRADPWGGFWIGTMGKNAEKGLGAIYRYYRGELRQILGNMTITNSIAFSPDKSVAYYTDTRSRKIMRQKLNVVDGWPTAEAEVFVDLTKEKLNPDGSVVDSEGCLWNAQWGAGRVARYSPEGMLVSTHPVPASQATCPAFGGPDLKTVYVTSAADQDPHDGAGKTFQFSTSISGQSEHRVRL